MTKTVLLLGGNRYNVKPIQAVREAGFRVIVADMNPNAPGLAVADIGLAIDLFDYDALEAAIRKEGDLHGIVSLAEAGIRPAAELTERFGLSSMPEHVAQNATSKAAMRRNWANSPYSVDFRVVHNLEEARQAVAEMQQWPLIVKPDHSFGGSRGVSRIENEDDLPAAIEFALSDGRPGSSVVIEGCITGTEYSTEVLIYQGKASVLTVGQKIKTPAPYRVDQSIQYPAPLSPEQMAEVRKMCQFAVDALGHHNGFAHIEFAFSADGSGPYLFELGARCGGGHTPLIAHHVSGVHALPELCRIACGMPPEKFTPDKQGGADYRFLIFPPGQGTEFDIPDSVVHHPHILDIAITVPGKTRLEPIRSTANRPGFVVGIGATREEAVGWAEWACQQTTFTYEDGHTDHALIFKEVMSNEC